MEGTTKPSRAPLTLREASAGCRESQQPGQDMRFDVPVVGLPTYEQMRVQVRRRLRWTLGHASFRQAEIDRIGGCGQESPFGFSPLDARNQCCFEGNE